MRRNEIVEKNNEVVEIGIKEAMEMTAKHQTRFVWLGEESLDQIQRMIGIAANKLVQINPTDITTMSKAELGMFNNSVFVCYSGGIARELAKDLREDGIKAYSLKDGIKAFMKNGWHNMETKSEKRAEPARLRV